MATTPDSKQSDQKTHELTNQTQAGTSQDTQAAAQTHQTEPVVSPKWHRLAWFVGLWGVSVFALWVISWVIRWAIE